MTNKKRDVDAVSTSEKTRARRSDEFKSPRRVAPKEDGTVGKFDVFDSAKRSDIMSRVRSNKNASTELKLIEVFKLRKIVGWRRGVRLFGKPDFVFPKLRIAVFVDGCFWHGHDCRNTKPKDNADYWRAKIERNRKRDQAATEHLQKLGYCVVRIWECDFKKANADRLNEKLRPIVEAYEALVASEAIEGGE